MEEIKVLRGKPYKVEYKVKVAKKIKIGIVGGIGPVSTIDYYRDIIEKYRERSGKDEYPDIVIDNVNMPNLVKAFSENNHYKVIKIVAKAINNLDAAGADVIAIASNTPHILYYEIAKKTKLPIISIVDATGDYIFEKDYSKVLILGTEFTMKSGLYDMALGLRGIESVTPDHEDIEALHQIIFPNLENGIVIPEDKEKMINIVNKYIVNNQVDSVILGCTEIPLMLQQEDISIPLINTAQLHIDAIVNYCFQ